MGKGVVPDTDKRCVSTARTAALQNADVVLLLGARLNWMLHFGRQPRFRADVKVIQVDVAAEEMNNSIPSAVTIQADVALTCESLESSLKARNFSFDANSEWWALLNKKRDTNKVTVTVSAWENSFNSFNKKLPHIAKSNHFFPPV